MSETTVASRRWALAGAYLAVWVIAFLFLRRQPDFQAEEAIGALVILGLALPALALLVTRRATPLPQPVRRPAIEAAIVTGDRVVVAVVLVLGFGQLARIAAEPLHSLATLAVKLVTFVAVPGALLVLAGCRWRELAPASLRGRQLWPALWMSLAILVVQGVLGRGLQDISRAGLHPAALLIGAPLCLLWLVVEVGVVEEFFFRALLQSRLAAAFRSEWAGLFAAALLFGLVHAPGLYLRPAATMEAVGPHPSLLTALAYSVGVTSLAGLFLGVLWLRTRNFALVVIVHAVGDLLPGLVPFLAAFHLGR